jgi:hypothetical protein
MKKNLINWGGWLSTHTKGCEQNKVYENVTLIIFWSS